MKWHACALSLGVLIAMAACDPRGLGRPNPNFLVIGHRGAPNVAAENTIPSFKVATAVGANAIETDVCITSDGIFVIWHDSDPASIEYPGLLPADFHGSGFLAPLGLNPIRFGPWQFIRGLMKRAMLKRRIY